MKDLQYLRKGIIFHGRVVKTDPDNTRQQILEPLSKMKKQYIADMRVMNYLLQAIPNDIYNSVDACKTTKEMWERIKSKGRRIAGSVYERLTTLVNIMDCNNVRLIPVSINPKFLNCLQPEWSKYVIMVHHNQTGYTVSYDQLYDSIVQFKPHIQASKAKRAARNHDPLALIAHSNASLSQSHVNPSYSYSPQSYYVTHPSSVVDYEEYYQGELQGDSQEDKLITAVMLLARAITQKFSIPTNNHLLTSSNIRNQNDFMLDNSYGDETLEEQTAVVIMMALIQPADDNAVTEPKYDAKVVSEVNAVTPRQSGNTRRNIMDIITTQWCLQ
ncbi:hypothetical protein Tco_0639759 [Tanacetum coccineum]